MRIWRNAQTAAGNKAPAVTIKSGNIGSSNKYYQYENYPFHNIPPALF
jgi:hypothetical protein